MSIQIKKKFLRSQSVDGSKVLFLNEDSFKALRSDGSESALFKLDSDNKFQLLEMPRVSSDPTHVNELARKSYVDAGDAAEALARAAADAAEQAAREDADAAIRSEFAAADALVLFESKEYTDEKVLVETTARSSEDAAIRFEFAAADLIEKTAREAADQLLRDDLDSEIATRVSEDARVLSESKAYTDAEKARAMAAEAAEAATRASEDARVLSESKAYTDQEVFSEQTRAIGVETELRSDLNQEIADRISDVDAEEARAMAAEAAEAAARAAADLTFLKLDGSRSMEGNLSMESTSAGAGVVDSWDIQNAGNPANPFIYKLTLTVNELSLSTGFIYPGDATGPYQSEPPVGLSTPGYSYIQSNEVVYMWAVPADGMGSPNFAASVKLGTLDKNAPTSSGFIPEGAAVLTKHKIVGLADGVATNDAVNKGQLSAVLSESKAYTDSSIASVIDAAPEAYNTLREIAEYIASDQTATSQILSQLYDHETRLDVIEGTGEGSIAKAEADAMAYTDAEKARAMAAEALLQSEIDAEESLRASEDIRILSESKAYTDAEKARAMAAEATEAATRASEDIRVLNESKAYTDVEVLAEKTRAMGQEAAIRSEFAAADAAIRLDLDDLDGYAQEIRSDLEQEILDRIADVNAEEARAMAAEAAESATRASEDIRILAESKAYTDVEKARAMAREAELQLELDAEEALRASEDVRVLSESKTYTDQKVAAVIDSAPEMLDTLRELAQALGNDQNFATSVTGYIATAKQEAKDYAKAQVDAFGERLAIESFEVSSMIITQNYIELQDKAFAMSIVASVDRLMMLEGEDYEVSVQNGKTRLIFSGSMIQGQEEALALGDKLRVRYLKDVRP